MKFHDETSCKKLIDDSDDDDRVQKKSGAELLQFDVDNEKTRLNKKRVFIGEAASTFIKELSLNPLSSQLSKFYENVMTFHRTVALTWYGPPHLFGGAYRQMTPYLFRGLENFRKSEGTSLPWGDLSISAMVGG